MSIVPKLAIAFLLAALIPAVTAMILFGRRSEQDALGQAEVHLQNLARDREELLVQHVDSLRREVAVLAESELVRRFLSGRSSGTPDADVEELAEDLLFTVQARTWGDTHHVYVVDAGGRVVLSPGRFRASEATVAAGDDDSHVGDSMGHLPEFRQALTEPVITSFFDFEERGHFHQLVLHPVRGSEGEELGVVAAEVAIDALLELFAGDIGLGRSGRVAIVTRAGTRIVHAKSDKREPVLTAGLAAALEGGSPVFQSGRAADGASVVGMYVPSSVYPWVVCIEVDRREILSATDSTHAFMMDVLVAISIVLGLGGLGLGVWFGLPLRRCARAAARVSAGDLQRPIPVTRGSDEIGILERSPEAMRARMAEQIRTLDQRVTQQTIELEDALAEAQQSQERFELAVQGSMDGIWDWNLARNEVYYAPRWWELLGVDPENVSSSPDEWFSRIASGDLPAFHSRLQQHIEGKTDRFDMELQMLHTNGEPRWMLCRAAAIRNAHGKAVRLAGSLADITDLKQAQDNLHRLAHHDRLTGLPNRDLFMQRLERTMARTRRERGREFAVLFFDFDRFKVVNDSLGHSLGDALLVAIADRFQAEIRDVDTAARFGGDEFVVLLDRVEGVEGAKAACERFLEVFERPHYLQGHEVVSTASIGLVVAGSDYESADAVLRDADAAMYQAKTAGKAQYRVFDSVMHAEAIQRLHLEQDLRNADPEREFELHFQPIVAIGTCEIAGFEALVRWQHPTLGLVSPDRFIPIAEETGLIVELGEWVLREACRQVVEWRAEFSDRKLFMNVNVSRKQLVYPSFLGALKHIWDEFDLRPGDVKLEITETTVMDARHDMVPKMEGIRDLGFQLSMDDFGTGYSSLSCLSQFPIDVLKIDRSFIENLEQSHEFTAVVEAIVTLAQHLSLEVVAEGIETAEQLAQLEVMDCDFAQGFLFSRPVVAEEAADLLRYGFERRLSA